MRQVELFRHRLIQTKTAKQTMKLIRIYWMRLSVMMIFISCITLLSCHTSNATTYPQLILSDNPVAYYQLEELSGATQALDSTTNGINANYAFDTGPDGTFPELGLPGIDTNSVFFKFYTDSNLTVHYGDIDIPYSP